MRSVLTAAIIFAASAASSIQAAAAEQLWLTMDQVRPFKLETPAKSIVVGNPAIADVTIQDNSNILLFFSGYYFESIFVMI